MKGKNWITIDGYSREELLSILDRCSFLKKELFEGGERKSLKGKTIAMIFEKASTRTRVSFQVGIAQLGGQSLFLANHELQLSRGEPIKDTARVLSRYVDAVVIRGNSHQDLVEFARWSSVPVINALTDKYHPSQIIADLFTVRESGFDLASFKPAWIGDGNNVAHSWINAAAVFGFKLVLACPAGYDPDAEVLERARAKGAEVELVRDPFSAVRDADIIYTDVWASMGQEAEKKKRLSDFKGFQVNMELIKAASAGVKLMHCLPAHRGEEITDEAMESEHSIVFDQAENRLHVQKAIIEMLLGGERTPDDGP
ncbi:MAG: ornithine carbamoyltransferase [bacterium]